MFPRRAHARWAATSCGPTARPSTAASTPSARSSAGGASSTSPRGTLDIDALGGKRIAQLIEAGLVRSVADLYALDWDKVAALERMGELSTANLQAAIEGACGHARSIACSWASTSVTWAPAGAEALARAFGDFDRILAAPTEALAAVEGVGGVIAESVTTWLSDPANRELVERLRAAGLNFQSTRTTRAAGRRRWPARASWSPARSTASPRRGRGRHQGPGWEVARQRLGEDDRRGRGRRAGDLKLSKAEELGIPILDEAAFTHLLDTGELPA